MSEDLLDIPLREVLDIPETVTADDFVMQLERGVEHSTSTLQQYVVTPGIADAMAEALGLLRKAVVERRSSGAFVHGSFGAGKSHFMAVLHLLLGGNAQARALPGLQAVVANHSDLLDRPYLLLDFHLLGKASLEDAIFGGYVEAIAERHPDAALPAVHESAALFEDATALRTKMGDSQFFSMLNQGRTTAPADGLGSLTGLGDLGSLAIGDGSDWDAEQYERAVSADVGSLEHTRLVQALTSKLFTSYVKTGEWLDMEAGLKAITDHAAELGYEGVVLFLDELVLWLAQHISDPSFIQVETSKVAKLVETGSGSLAVPIVSFVARQRDLKDFLGGAQSGAEQAAIGQSFQWWEDRFDRIELAAADLPRIVNQRLLQPRDERGREALNAAIGRVKGNSQAWTALLTDEAHSSEDDFRLVYPFSPALVDAMVALSSLMQRERTALKIMSELLSKGRDRLRAQDVIRVGELFDAVVLSPAKPLTPEMRQRFQVAESFYVQRFRPFLLQKHSLREDDVEGLDQTHTFLAEDLLMKTLLVAFIAPGTPSLANLTAGRLAALNFGAVRAQIPGREAVNVTAWARDWAKSFGDVEVGDGKDPLISLRLSGVDYESVVGRVENEDTPGNRRALVQLLVAEELGLGEAQGFEVERKFTHVWRGSRREVDVVFGNIRDTSAVPSEMLRARDGRWRVVIDHPFDEPGHSPSDDLVRLANEREAGLETTTLSWIPSFLTAERLQDVGRLVLLEYLATPTRFDANARHLAVSDREPARQALENQRRALKQTVVSALRQGYGIVAPNPVDVDSAASHEVFTALTPDLKVHAPLATDLREGLEKALDVALSHQYPDHPQFKPADQEIRRSDVSKVLVTVRKTVEQGGRSDGLDRALANTMAWVTGPLGLGETRETVYALSSANFRWNGEFTRAEAEASANGEVSVAILRERLASTGLLPDLQDLLILAWAAIADREVRRYGAPAGELNIGGLTGDMTFRRPVLPSPEEWKSAVERAQGVFGIAPELNRSAAALGRTGSALREKSRAGLPHVRELEAALDEHREMLGLTEASPRMATAIRARELLAALTRASGDLEAIQVLAAADIPAEPQALAKSIASAADVSAELRGTRWQMIGAARGHAGGDIALSDLASAANSEELHQPLGVALTSAVDYMERILIAQTSAASATPVPAPAPVPQTSPQPVEPRRPAKGVDDIELDIYGTEAGLGQLSDRFRAMAEANPGKSIRVTLKVL